MIINYLYFILAFAISMIFSLICTPLVIKLCNTHGLYDEPNARKVHKQSIPRLGGTLFMPSLGIGVAATLLIMYRDADKNIEINISSVIVIAGALLIYLIGILDDLKGDHTRKYACGVRSIGNATIFLKIIFLKIFNNVVECIVSLQNIRIVVGLILSRKDLLIGGRDRAVTVYQQRGR